MAFGLYANLPVPMPADEFPPGIQVQQDEVDVGPTNPQFISFDNDFVLTYDSASGTVHVEVANAGSGGGGGGATETAQGVRASMAAGQTGGNDIVFDDDAGGGNWSVGGGYNPATGIYTVPASGDGYVHAVSAEVLITNGGEAGTLSNELSLLLNGGSALAIDRGDIPTTGLGERIFKMNAGAVLLAAGDTIKVRAATALSTNMQAQAGLQSHLSVVRLFHP